jgi:predicted O-methyltransferase YrrM
MRFDQIYSYVEANKPHTCLEIGTWNGHNATRLFAEGIKKYIGFDLWEDGDDVLDDLENNAKKRVTLAEVTNFLKSFDTELIKGNSRETLKEYAKDKKPFVDMAIIDGGHSIGTIKSDLLTLLPIMKADGVIFLDDYYFNCPTPNIGAQTVLCNVQIPYTVLPRADKARDGSIVKIVRIDMKDVPRLGQHDTPEGSSWQFKPAA